MLSRLSVTGRECLKRNVLKFHPVNGITTSAVAYDNPGKTSSPAASNHPPEYPPPTSKRDFVNFPRPIWAETAPPVRLAFIPESWFDFLYPKTGYTGPYMLCAGLVTYLFSKEFIVLDHNGGHLLGFIFLLSVIHIKLGDTIGAFCNKILQDSMDNLDGQQEREKQNVRNEIKGLERYGEIKNAIAEVTKGTTEMVHFQMELAFRDRLNAVYNQVKNKLDCQAELENVERRIAQKNLMDYVLTNVMKSITPEMEKNSMQLCIKDLNSLSAKS